MQWAMSALPLKADVCGAIAEVRFVPIADIATSAHSKSKSAFCDRLAVQQVHSFMVVARDAIERALIVIRILVIKPGEYHGRAALWARRSFVAHVWKVRIVRHE